ncbi:MAG: DUF5674 family protein [Nitrospira sp.]|nr:DUF5674 family protein [Nitrospira sp.]MCP9475768.1 DUF5674 family protein [Nitrospira sp.]
MDIRIIRDAITKEELRTIAAQQFGDMVKAVVDVEREIMAIGGELHADEETVLLENGSHQENLWGVNLYPEQPPSEWIEFDSMINIRPAQSNRSRFVENATIRDAIVTIILRLVRD